MNQANVQQLVGYTRVWPFNPRAMDGKTRPFKVYTLDVTNFLDGDNDDFDGLDNDQKEPKEDGATKQLLNLIAIIKDVRIDYHK